MVRPYGVKDMGQHSITLPNPMLTYHLQDLQELSYAFSMAILLIIITTMYFEKQNPV